MKTKKFLYFIGDAFSSELLGLLENTEDFEFIPVTTFYEFDFNEITGVLYTPSLNFKEKTLLLSLPTKLKKIAILDLFHFDFKDYLQSFKQFPPDVVFTPRALECTAKEFVITPSFIQHIYNPLDIVNSPQINEHDICFVSQPLLEERTLSFNQYDLIIKFQILLKEVSPAIKLYIKPHPREELNRHKDHGCLIVQSRPRDTLASFHYFTGFNSALLYAAEGLGKKVYWISHPDEITQATISSFLTSKKINSPDEKKPSAISILIEKLNSLTL